MRRLVFAAVTGAAVIGSMAPTFAATLPVAVHESTKDGVAVGVDVNGQPGVGVVVANGRACVGMSYQVPQCADIPPVTTDTQIQKLPVTVYHDDTRTVVGAGDIGVVVYSSGRICPAVSTQDWPCVDVQLG
jgi:hypothetical protein